MQVFKGFILLVIWIASTSIGILASKKYSNRAHNLKEIKNSLNILESKIKFTYEPLPEIFNQISKNMQSNVAEIFKIAKEKMEEITVEEAWEQAVISCNLDLNKEDVSIISGLGRLLRQN